MGWVHTHGSGWSWHNDGPASGSDAWHREGRRAAQLHGTQRHRSAAQKDKRNDKKTRKRALKAMEGRRTKREFAVSACQECGADVTDTHRPRCSRNVLAPASIFLDVLPGASCGITMVQVWQHLAVATVAYGSAAHVAGAANGNLITAVGSEDVRTFTPHDIAELVTRSGRPLTLGLSIGHKFGHTEKVSRALPASSTAASSALPVGTVDAVESASDSDLEILTAIICVD